MKLILIISVSLLSFMPGKYGGHYMLPPVPEGKTGCDETIDHIYKTDQDDRIKFIIDTANFNFEKLYRRDSIRLQKIRQLDSNGCINDHQTAFKAGFVFLHNGGDLLNNDAAYLKRASELFILAAQKTDDPFKIKSSLKMSELAYNCYLRETKTHAYDTSLINSSEDIRFFYCPGYLDSIKIQMKRDIKKELSKMGLPEMPEEKLDQTVNHSIEKLKLHIKKCIKKAKNKHQP